MSAALCVDVGSTFTKAALVDTDTGALLGTAAHRTTLDTDVMDGVEACRAALVTPGEDPPVLACSSAGGGLRIAVVGNEELVTAEAGRRVALSSGGTVVHVGSGGLDDERVAALRDSAPDVLLLVGGTDGGNSEGLVADARVLAHRGWAGPVVVAGDVEAQDAVAAELDRAGTPYVVTDNVVPRIGVLAPEPARAAIRETFLRHVIGGKHLSARPEFLGLVRGATPDLVLSGVEVLADVAGDVVVVDVGGATTDVHSVVELDPEDAGLGREVVASTRVTRTVEGDLGMRWGAASLVEAAVGAGLLDGSSPVVAAAERRRADPDLLPADRADREDDRALGALAVTLAVRRHAGRAVVVLGDDGRVVERTGRDLRPATLLVGSGGVLRHAAPEDVETVLAGALGVSPEGWQLPERPRVVVDRDYVLAAVGLLAADHPDAARALAGTLLG